MAEGERFTFEETKILELFKKLSSAAQNKVREKKKKKMTVFFFFFFLTVF